MNTDKHRSKKSLYFKNNKKRKWGGIETKQNGVWRASRSLCLCVRIIFLRRESEK
jgi:hypothetical protein